MRVLDAAVALWSLQLGLWIVASALGIHAGSQPGPLVGETAVKKTLIATAGDPMTLFTQIMSWFVASIVLGLALSTILGLNTGQTVLAMMGIAFGLFLIQRAYGVALAAGTFMKTLLESAFPGIVFPQELATTIDWLMILLSFIAIVDWWRGSTLRYMG